jgi:hypothetical protein
MTRIAVLTFGLLVLQAVPASAAPDLVRQEMCSDGARVRLELTDMGDRIKVRVEVHRSEVGHSWRIVLRHGRVGLDGFDHGDGQVKFEGTRVASEDGDLAVQRSVVHQEALLGDGFVAKAVDRQTGQFCRVEAAI